MKVWAARKMGELSLWKAKEYKPFSIYSIDNFGTIQGWLLNGKVIHKSHLILECAVGLSKKMTSNIFVQIQSSICIQHKIILCVTT